MPPALSVNDCIAVTQKLRQEADLDRTIVELEQIYARSIAQHLTTGPDRRADQHALARYLSQNRAACQDRR
jgi:hypothetical protein